jgi:tetratricopeptide (TPR) repeat protein
MGKPEKVEEYFLKSADTYKKKYTEQHPSYAKVTADLGNFYRMQGRYAEAETLLNKALNIRETTLGKSHPDFVRTQEDIAILYTGRRNAWKMRT